MDEYPLHSVLTGNEMCCPCGNPMFRNEARNGFVVSVCTRCGLVWGQPQKEMYITRTTAGTEMPKEKP
jgi:hypothetical protein